MKLHPAEVSVIAAFFGAVGGALVLSKLLVAYDFNTRQIEPRTDVTVLGAMCPVYGCDTIAPAPYKLFQYKGAPQDWPRQEVHNEDQEFTDKLINGFYSPATPGGIGE